MKTAIVLDNKVNKWALQRFEPLKNDFDITVFVGERNDYDVSSIDLKKKHLSHKEEIALAIKEPLTAFKRNFSAPYKRMDYYYFSLKKHIKDFDIVYSYDLYRSAYTLASLKKEHGYKLVLAWWENIPFKLVFDDKSSFQKGLIMENVDLFLPFTQDAKDNLLMEGIPEEKVNVISPGVDIEKFSPGDRPRALMEKNRIPEGSFVILYVGKLVSWKGVHNLVYAAKILKDRGIKDFIFAVAGKGAQKDNMLKIIAESGTEGHFRFLDFIPYDRMPDIYRMADALVLPSYPTMTWQEQFGMVLAEAMASGTPVISTLSGSIPEVLRDAAMLIPPGDFVMLADNVIKLIETPDLREDLSSKARARAEKVFDANRISGELLDVLTGI